MRVPHQTTPDEIDRMEVICESARSRLNKIEGRWIDKVGPSTPDNPALPSDFGRTTDIFEYFRLMLVEYRMPGRTGQRLDELAQKVAALVEEFFLGEWRQSFDNPEKLRYQWFDELRFGMLAGLLLQDQSLFRRIIPFPVADLPHDDGAWDRTVSDNQVYKTLCASLQTGEEQPVPALRGKRPKALQQVISAIFQRDNKLFLKAWNSYLNWYKKCEHEDRGNMLICLDGSILLLIAKAYGLPTRELQEQDHPLLLGVEDC